jgi:hypothetical protein
MVVLAFISDPPVVSKILRHLKLPTTPPPLAAPRDMWEPESNLLIPPMDEHGIDERDLAGIQMLHVLRPDSVHGGEERDSSPEDIPIMPWRFPGRGLGRATSEKNPGAQVEGRCAGGEGIAGLIWR